MMRADGAAGVAVVGCGYWGRNLVRNFAELGALKAVVDANPQVAAALGERFCVPALTLEEALAHEDVSAIATASPAHLHREVAMAAIEAGRHVFVEKPIALSTEDGEAMRDAADRAGVALMVGHLLQYHPAYRRLRELVGAGEIGRLRYVYSNRMSMGKLRTQEDVVWSFAPHDISMILGLAGEAPSNVEAFGTAIVSKALSDTAHLHLSFASGLKAHVFASWLSPFKEHRLVAIGEAGSLVFDDTQPWSGKLVRTDHAVVDGPALKKGDAVAVELEEAEPLKEECRHFLDVVSGGGRPRTDANEALAVLGVLRQASAALGGA